MVETLFETKEILRSRYLFGGDEVIERDFQANYDRVTSPDFPIGQNESASAFVYVERDFDGSFTHESGVMITSRLPEKVIDGI